MNDFALHRPGMNLATVSARLAGLGRVESLPMFGGVGLRVDGVLVALWRDEQLYVRDAQAKRAFQPFPASRLRLDFRPVAPGEDWLSPCWSALQEVKSLARRVPRRNRYRARRLEE